MDSRAVPKPDQVPQEEPILPLAEDLAAQGWAERAEKAQEARALGQKLRRGKRVLFSNMQHPGAEEASAHRSSSRSRQRVTSVSSSYATTRRPTTAG